MSSSSDASELVDLLIGDLDNITLLNSTFTGADGSAGSFTAGTFGIEEGLLLTTGSIDLAAGPNVSQGTGADQLSPGDPFLDALASPFSTEDAAILEIEFIPAGDNLQFNYVFASDEYNEFVCSSFNDVFGFFINGGDYENENIAILPESTTPVAINNVNNGSIGSSGSMSNCSEDQLQHSQFYVENGGGINIEYDGYTTVLPISIPLEQGVTYTIRLAIADAADGFFDSGVFIEAGSFLIETFECLDLEANVGDTCDDEDNSTEGDTVNEACICEGSPIISFDCSELEANFGDTCQNNAGAEGTIDVDCMCFVETPMEGCESFRYFLADNPTSSGDSKLYEFTIDEENSTAELEEILALPYDFHIAYDGNFEEVFIIRSANGNFRTLDVSVEDGELSEETVLSETLGSAVAAGLDPNGILYIGSQDNDAVYTADRETGMVSFFRNAPVHGGDLAFRNDGNAYLATRDGDGRVNEMDAMGETSFVRSVPGLVTGLAITADGNGLISVRDRNRLYLGDDEGNELGAYVMVLDGEVFTTANGDMASGCSVASTG
ncbi:MAG TPA: choice-of-anchor L domain-containing protein, partial [Cryomorphaceae bacterium]|nr:choice-of-anchor L domain-containing protein [Cryomorphaceae bacterium]